MQYFSLINFLALAMPAVILAAPLEAPVLDARDLEARTSLRDISIAQNAWQQHTSAVSSFLSNAQNLRGQSLVNSAIAALNTARDEPVQKAVLDSVFVFVRNPRADVQQANNILVDQGTFKFILDGLADFANNGARFNGQDIAARVAEINGDRCGRVLPAIDTYFRAAASVLQNGITLHATRPVNC